MKIEPPADDYGLQNYKIQKKAEGEIRQPDHVEPFPSIGHSEERREKPPRQPESRERHGGGERREGEERRQGERRQEHQGRPLDTRAGDDRRKDNRRE